MILPFAVIVVFFKCIFIYKGTISYRNIVELCFSIIIV
jgi:hypothetical protein